MNFILVALGGAFGAVSRYGLQIAFSPFFRAPIAILIINVIGSFLIGVIAFSVSQNFHFSAQTRLLLTTGFLGAFTTFSTYSLDIVSLWFERHYVFSISYAVGSVVLCVLATMLGFLLVQSIR